MAEKLCVYCHKTILEGFDETERKYYEKGTKTHHTRERCEAAKQGASQTASTGQSTSQELAELVKKVDQLVVLVTDMHNKISGQSSLDIET